MESSYLIQRLQKPFKSNDSLISKLDFSFGGGLVNGGISKQGMALIKDIFRFDYMGSSEFEWGAVPEALQKIAKNRESYVSSKISIDKNIIYIICNRADIDEVQKRIIGFSKDKYHNTKERICLYEVLKKEKYNDFSGWLELDNGYFFFTDKVMFDKTVALFGIKDINEG